VSLCISIISFHNMDCVGLMFRKYSCVSIIFICSTFTNIIQVFFDNTLHNLNILLIWRIFICIPVRGIFRMYGI